MHFDISVLIPTYKRNEKLIYCLTSIIKAKKDYPIEIIVVDNDPLSTVKSDIASLINDYSIKYYKNEENLGMTGNWNRCLKLSHGIYSVFVHDDDFVYEDYFDITLSLLKMRNIDILAVKYDKMVNNEIVRFKGSGKLLRLNKFYFLKGNILGPPTGVLFKRKLYLESGLLFDDSYYPCSDFLFWIKLVKIAKKCFILKKTLYCYRIEENESLNLDIQNLFLSKGIRILEKEFFSKSRILYLLFHDLYRTDWSQSMRFVWNSQIRYTTTLYNRTILKIINKLVH